MQIFFEGCAFVTFGCGPYYHESYTVNLHLFFSYTVASGKSSTEQCGTILTHKHDLQQSD